MICFSTLVSATTFAACSLQVLHAVLPHACVVANPNAGPFAGMRSFHRMRQPLFRCTSSRHGPPLAAVGSAVVCLDPSA